MKAIVCKELGPPETLTLEDLPEPTAKPGQVVVEVKAAGANYPDALVVQGKHQIKPELPFGVGAELAGIVKSVGQGADRFKVGDAVYGMRLRGSFTQAMAVDESCLQLKPSNVTFEQAAAIPVTYNTSYFALVTLAKLQAGETVLVLGASGGVGYAAIQIAKAVGARVIAAASTPEKLAVCKSAGADELINYNSENLREQIRTLTEGKGVDVVYDPVGGSFAEPSMRGLAWKGRYLVVGFASGEIPKLPLNLALLKNASIIGVFLGEACSRDPALAREIDEGVSSLAREGKIMPLISGRYGLEKVPEVLRSLLERKVIGKIVICPFGVEESH